MRREIYEIEALNKARHTKDMLCVEIDINNFAKITRSYVITYDADVDMEASLNSNITILIGKVNSIDDLINLLKPYYPNLVKENLKLLSSVKWTDWNYSPTEEN